MRSVVDIAGMRILALSLMALLACTKPNPNRCCTDEADCAAAGLPAGMTCDDGRVCRANVCIAEVCSAASDCDVLAPYCVDLPDGHCDLTCSEDAQCPGNGQASSEQFCEAGACVACRAASDCTAAAPVCTDGACVTCTLHEQCPSGACTTDGSCANEVDVAYVDLAGSVTSDCTRLAPCTTIERALSLSPNRLFVVIRPGTYVRTGPLTVSSPRWLIGSGTSRPVLDRNDDGPIVIAEGPVNLHLEQLELSGATGALGGAAVNTGHAVYCRAAGGAPAVAFNDVLIQNNVGSGMITTNCAVSASRSVFRNNGGSGLELRDSTGQIDRSTFIANGVGLTLDAGVFTVTNSFVVRNASSGVLLYSTNSGNRLEFNTIADNGGSDAGAFGVSCTLPSAQAFPSNIIARNRMATVTSNCTFPGSIVVDADIAALKFKQPDVAPYDYHIMPGSLAVDMGTISTLDHDFDGDARPKGAGRDVGADEAQ